MMIKMNMILLMMTLMTVGSLRDDDDEDDGSGSFPGLTKLTCVDSNFIASIWTA